VRQELSVSFRAHNATEPEHYAGVSLISEAVRQWLRFVIIGDGLN